MVASVHVVWVLRRFRRFAGVVCLVTEREATGGFVTDDDREEQEEEWT